MTTENMIDYAVALGQQGRLLEAEEMLRRAIATEPGNARAHINLGVALQAQEKLDDALAVIRHAIELHPNESQSHHTLAKVLIKLARPAEAADACRRAIQLNPDDAEAHGTLARTLLLTGDFKRGWMEYEWRWKCGSFEESKPQFAQPRWNGAKVNGKIILLRHEQGFGDAIQFLRYAPLVAQRGGEVILQCPNELLRLAKRMPAITEVVPLGANPPPFDLHLSLMSLPLAFNTTLKTIPAEVPYLSADPRLVEVWRQKVQGDGVKLRVGISWSGRPTHREDRQRSLRLEQLAPLAAVPDVVFYSLQKWDPDKQAANPPAGMKLIDIASKLQDFSDTAALIANLDLIISVDTAIVHLAGALSKPVWTLLPFSPDFRWMLGRTDTPWYPSMRLLRQSRPGDWSDVIARTAELLGNQVASGNLKH